jgi:predicted DNA-binding transcriptional regulator YafY
MDRDAARSYRLDRTRTAKVLRKTFEPRDGFDPAMLQDVSTARVWYAPAVARWEVEKGARALVDGSAVGDRSVGSADWLVGEVLAYGGNAVVLTPADLRKRVADRATELERELRAARSKAVSA